MPLSEQEQRLLDEMERNLYQNDADFVATVAGRRGKPNYTLLAIAGVAALVAGVITQLAVIGVVGFGLMLAGVLIVLSPGRRDAAEVPTSPAAGGAARPSVARSSWTERMNERWDRRQEGREG